MAKPSCRSRPGRSLAGWLHGLTRRRWEVIACAFLLGILNQSSAPAGDLNPVLRATWTPDPPAEPGAVAMGGDGLAFVALSDSSLAILDIRDPNNPQQVSRLQTIGAHDIVVSHGIAYLAGFLDGLQLIDVREPGHPRPVGSYLGGLAIMDVAVSGSLAYVTGYTTGDVQQGSLELIDVSNPAEPRSITSYSFRERPAATSVAVFGHLAYVTIHVTAGLAGPPTGSLVVIDVSDPDHLREIGQCDIGGWPVGVEISGQFAYLAVAGNSGGNVVGGGLQVIDVSDPTKPRRVSGYGSQMGANSLAIEGQIAHLASDGDGALHVVDISNSNDPKRIGTYRAVGNARAVAVSGRFAYLTHETYDRLGHVTDGRVEIIDLSLPANPTRLNEYAAGGWTHGVVVTDNTVYLASGSAGLLAITVGDQGSVTRVGEISSGAEVRAVSVTGRYACIVEYEIDSGVEWLQVVDVANPTHPQWAGRYQTGGSSWAVQSVGDVAYLAAGHAGLIAVDLTDPTSPRQLSDYPTRGGALDVLVTGQQAYVVSGVFENGQPRGWLEILDVADRSSPRVLSTFEPGGWLSSVTVAGNLAYLANGMDGLLVIDVSDAANPQTMARCYIGGNATDVEISGTVAYVATYMGGVRVVDVSDPVNPGLVGGNSAFTANAVVAHGAKVFVAGGSDGLIILNKYTELRIGPAIVLSDGRVLLQLSGPNGQCVRVQRSANLIDWEDWRTVTLDGTGCELIDETAAASQRFYRAVEDNSVATK